MTVIGLRLSSSLRIIFQQLFIVTVCLFSLPPVLTPTLSASPAVVCVHEKTGGEKSMDVWVSANESGLGAELDDTAYVPSGTNKIFIHATATASGYCQAKVFVGGVCVDQTGGSGPYTVSTIENQYTFYPTVAGDPTITGGGAIMGRVSCTNTTTKSHPSMSSVNNCNPPNGSTMPTTGPLSLGYVPIKAGLYQIKARGILNQTACNFDRYTDYAYTTYYSNPEGEWGCTSCNTGGTGNTNAGSGGSTSNGPNNVASNNGSGTNDGVGGASTSVGEPVSVINGNMYLDQTDFELPGLGAGLRITRAYNSLSNRIGLFGESWTSNLEAQVVAAGPDHFFLRWGDGSGTFFKHAGNNEYLPLARRNWFVYGLKLADNTYQVYAKGGLIYQFNIAGNLIAIKDRNNNQTTITRNTTNQRIETVTDAEGRSVNFIYNGTEANRVRSLTNSNGTIATYTYSGNSLYNITYADGSKYQFVFAYVGNRSGIGKVLDFYGNILEQHEYSGFHMGASFSQIS